MGAIDLNALLKISEHWYDRTGLFITVTVVLMLEASVVAFFGAPFWVSAIVAVISTLSILGVWAYSRRPPRARRNRVGFLVSLCCADDAESKRVREDFVFPLRQLIKSGHTGHLFHFIELPERIAKTIEDVDDAMEMRRKCRAHFMLWGRVRLRVLNGREHHVIDLEGGVAHKAVPDEVRHRLSQEFGELMPRHVSISTENDLLSFQFTSEWADTVARYVIGIAAAVSGDFDYAQALYSESLQRVNSKPGSFPIFLKLKERIPIRISELYETRASSAYLTWASNHTQPPVDFLGAALSQIAPSRLTRPDIVNLRAIHAFLKDRDTSEGIKFLKTANAQDSSIWHYNLAFLHAYQGNLRTAAMHYRKGARLVVNPTQLAQVEEFICWVLREEPANYQLAFCLGLLNWKAKGDHQQALADFRDFVSHGRPDEFRREKTLAAKWIQELNIDAQTSSSTNNLK